MQNNTESELDSLNIIGDLGPVIPKLDPRVLQEIMAAADPKFDFPAGDPKTALVCCIVGQVKQDIQDRLGPPKECSKVFVVKDDWKFQFALRYPTSQWSQVSASDSFKYVFERTRYWCDCYTRAIAAGARRLKYYDLCEILLKTSLRNDRNA